MVATIALIVLASVTVTLPAEVRVVGTEMTLGDVVTLQGDKAEVARVASIPLGYTPAPGYHRLLHRHRLLQRIRSFDAQIDVIFEGETTSLVLPRTKLVSAGEIEGAARIALEGDPESYGASLTLVRPVASVEVPEGERPYEIQAEKPLGGVRPGEIALSVRILVDGQIYRTVWTQWSVEMWRLLPVLTSDVVAGQPIEAGMVIRRRVQVRTELEGAPLDAARIVGTVAARDLRAGQVFTARDVVRPRLVEVGDPVHLHVMKGQITATAAATAMQGGAIGDRIRVTIVNSKREMTGVIQSRDIVVVRLGR